MSGGRHGTDRPRDGLHAAPKQRPITFGVKRKPERIRTGPLATAVLGSPSREGQARRVDRFSAGWVCKNRATAFGKRPGSPRPGGHPARLPKIRGDRFGSPDVAMVFGA